MAWPGVLAFDLITDSDVWWKAVKISDAQGARVQDVQSENGRSITPAPLLSAAAVRNGLLVLAKAKFLGFHVDVYEVLLDDHTLAVVTGHTCTFRWLQDHR